MDPSGWASLRQHYERACDLSGSARTEFLDSLARTDPALFTLVSDLLASQQTEILGNSPWQVRVIEPAERTFAFQTGEVLAGRYEIEEFLGSGGAGEVYRAHDRYRQVRVALKTIRPFLLSGADGMAALRQELNTASLISHPNVCRLYDIALAPSSGRDVAFITMELLAGETLAGRLRRERFRSADAYPIVVQLVNGIAAAHGCRVIHRDLKPANILLVSTAHGIRAVITDFGLARQVKAGADLELTVTGSIAGTPAYMAPEQLEGKQATEASDLHALGVIMYEMVTGQLPFGGETPVMIASARLRQDAPNPRKLVPDLDPCWEHAILACLERNPANRPRSVFDVLSLLTVPPARRWPRRALLALAGSTALAGAFSVLRPRKRNPLAEQAMQQGLVYIRRRTSEGVGSAIRELRLATKLEPEWADAWATLAEAYTNGENFRLMEPSLAKAEARRAADRAVAADAHLARAQGVLAWVQSLDFDAWPHAEQTFRRAIRMDGNDPDVRRWFAAYLRKIGKFRESEEHTRAGIALTQSADPRFWSELAFLFMTAQQMEQFHREAAHAQQLFPNNEIVELMMVRSLEIRGKFDEAVQLLNYAEKLKLTPVTVIIVQGEIAASRRDFAAARGFAAQAEQIWQTKPVDGLLLAGVYARIGDAAKTFSTLAEAYRRKDSTLLSIATTPWLRSVHSDPRFAEWLKKLHFTPQIMQSMEFRSASRVG